MGWTIEFTKQAEKQLKKLDKQTAIRILKVLHERIIPLENPRALGKALQGQQLSDYWRYRVGDYRIIVKIEDDKLIILVLSIGHRSSIYKL